MMADGWDKDQIYDYDEGHEDSGHVVPTKIKMDPDSSDKDQTYS